MPQNGIKHVIACLVPSLIPAIVFVLGANQASIRQQDNANHVQQDALILYVVRKNAANVHQVHIPALAATNVPTARAENMQMKRTLLNAKHVCLVIHALAG